MSLDRGFPGRILQLVRRLSLRARWGSSWLVGAVTVAAVYASSTGAQRAADLVRVPNVRGDGIEYAFTQLRARGFAVSIPRFPASYNQRDAFAIGTEVPRVGSLVPRGSTVTLRTPFFVLIGMSGMPGRRPTGGMTIVPSVVGLPLYEAMRRLQRAGVYSQIAEMPAIEHSTSRRLFDGYVVKRQSPRAGTRVRWAGILYTSSTSGAIDVARSQVTLIPTRR